MTTKTLGRRVTAAAAAMIVSVTALGVRPAAAEWVGLIYHDDDPPFYGRPVGRISIGTGVEIINGERHICTYYFDSPKECRPLDNPIGPEPDDDEWTVWTWPELWFLNY